MRRATLPKRAANRASPISIHALLAESDQVGQKRFRQKLAISIHALLAESDSVIDIINNIINDFYPRSPCGERLISPHSTPDNGNFYPRSPCGERPTNCDQGASTRTISIHALLAESDSVSSVINNVIDNFYPRSPCGERPAGAVNLSFYAQFLSTLSLRRATEIVSIERCSFEISIHALLAESDKVSVIVPSGSLYFYPRSPCGERQTVVNNIVFMSGFLSTLSLRRATL